MTKLEDEAKAKQARRLARVAGDAARSFQHPWDNDKLNQADFEKCGAGTDHCCAFLMATARGAECGRALEGIRAAVNRRAKAHLLASKRIPLKAYPECQNV